MSLLALSPLIGEHLDRDCANVVAIFLSEWSWTELPCKLRESTSGLLCVDIGAGFVWTRELISGGTQLVSYIRDDTAGRGGRYRRVKYAISTLAAVVDLTVTAHGSASQCWLREMPAALCAAYKCFAIDHDRGVVYALECAGTDLVAETIGIPHGCSGRHPRRRLDGCPSTARWTGVGISCTCSGRRVGSTARRFWSFIAWTMAKCTPGAWDAS